MKIKKVAKGHNEVVVRGHVHFNDTCESRGPVEIYLDEAPKGGTVCARQGKVRLTSIWPDKNNQHCLGKRISGVFVIYVPYASFTGNDAVRYTTKGHKTLTYEAEIRVETGQAPSETTSSPSDPQKAGPMPMCPALVS